MKQIKIFISLLAFCLFIFAITAKDLPYIAPTETNTTLSPPGPADPKAKAVIDSIYERYDEFKSLKVDMVYSTGYQNNFESDTIQGFMEGDKYRLEMPHQEVVHDGKKVWFYNKVSKKVFHRPNNPEEFNFMYPTKVLRSWESTFNYSIAGEWNRGEHTYVRMLFVPKTDELSTPDSRQINLFIDKSNFQILKITFSKPDGYIHVLDYHDMKPNIKFEPAVFEFDFS